MTVSLDLVTESPPYRSQPLVSAPTTTARVGAWLVAWGEL